MNNTNITSNPNKYSDMIKNFTETEFFSKESLKVQVLCIIKDQKEANRKQIAIFLEKNRGQGACPPVPLVSYVPEKIKKIGDKGDKRETGTTDSSLMESIKKTLSRLVQEGFILADRSSKAHIYTITPSGISYVENLYNNFFHEKNGKYESRKKQDADAASIVIAFKDYFDDRKDKILENYTSGKAFYQIDILELSIYNPDLVEILLERPDDSIKCARLALENLLSGQGYEGDLRKDCNIIFSNAPKSCRKNITNIRVADLNTLINVMGEVRSRGKSQIQITSIKYECPSCGNLQKISQTEDKERKPSKCANCGYKGKFTVFDKEEEDFLKLTVYDLYENISSNEVPEELNIYLQKDLYGFSYLKEGDKVEITGFAMSEEKTDNKGNKLLFADKIFVGYGLKKLDNSFTDDLITKEEEKKIEEISKDPIKFHKEFLFSDLHDVDLGSTIASICLYGTQNILFVGHPGCGKTEIMRRVADVSLKGKFANCSTSSSSGILGSVTKNEFTGRYTLDGGVFRPVHPNGIVVLDEINRDNDKELQKAILGVMNDKKININKANTRIDEACDVSTWCTANPMKKVNDYNKPHETFALLEPLYDRFDFVVYFTNQLDWTNLELVENLLNDEKKKFKLDSKEIELIRKYQMKAFQVDVKLNEQDSRKLAILMKDVLPKFGEKLSYRRLKTVSNLLKSICRMHLRDHTVEGDYKLLTDLFLKLASKKTTFGNMDLMGD